MCWPYRNRSNIFRTWVLFSGLEFKTLNLGVKRAIREVNLIKTSAALTAENVEVYGHVWVYFKAETFKKSLKKPPKQLLCTQAACSGLFSV